MLRAFFIVNRPLRKRYITKQDCRASCLAQMKEGTGDPNTLSEMLGRIMPVKTIGTLPRKPNRSEPNLALILIKALVPEKLLALSRFLRVR